MQARIARALALALCAAPSAAQTELVSATSAGTSGDQESWETTVSSDGRFVTFVSFATDLVPGDTNGLRDAFLRDRLLGATVRVNVDASGAQANGTGGGPYVSGDGRFVAFYSDATNLVPGDQNGSWDVFVRELSSGAIERASVDSFGQESYGDSTLPCLSHDGRFAAFPSDADGLVPLDLNGEKDIFVRDRLLATTERASVDSAGVEGNGRSAGPAISSDGRFVAFASVATNLVSGDTNGKTDVFVRDRASATTLRASLDSLGAEANGHSGYEPGTGYLLTAISAGGRWVLFPSFATNLVPGDLNGVRDVFVRDLVAGATERVSVDSAGGEANGWSHSTHTSAISGDGRLVAFYSAATNLASGDQNGAVDCFLRDRAAGTTVRVSVDSLGGEANGDSAYPVIAASADVVAFHSAATNLAPGDGNGARDAFARKVLLACAPPTVYCTAKVNSLGCLPAIGWSGTAALSGPGPFHVTAAGLLNQKSGILFYGVDGAWSAPFQGGVLCVRTPLARTPLFSTGGNPPPDDCSGTADFDFKAWALSGVDPALVAGRLVWAQIWSRDPAAATPTSLTDALEFRLCP